MNKLFFALLIWCCSSCLTAFANTPAAVDEFLATSYTPAFDCPNPEIKDQISELLLVDDLSTEQKFKLLTRQSHALICARDYTKAQTIIQGILADDEADRSARYYLAAIYQYGFIYDVNENDERCNYYLLAKDSAADEFLDIKTSATLNYASNCSSDADSQLTTMYEILEEIIISGDKAAMAHAHNTIGLFYGEKGHYQLAADQYLKATEIAREIYTDENRLTILTSAMTVLMAANDMDRARAVLDEFIDINKRVNTTQTNFLQYYSEAGFYIRTKDYKNLEATIAKWETIKQHYDNTIAQSLFAWYTAELCLVNQDRDCLIDFVSKEVDRPKNYATLVDLSKDYLLFRVNLAIFLNDPDQIRERFDRYNFRMGRIQESLQDVNAVNNVAEFQKKIINLETQLAKQQNYKLQVLIGAVLVLIAALTIVIWIFRQRLLKTQSIDAVTGLLNNTAVINELTKLAAPGEKRTNALAIFDIANFTEVNLTVGATKGDFVLKQIANTFTKITRNSDLLGVFGPGRFILCLSDIEEDAAQAFFERAKEALTNTFKHEHGTGPVSVDSSMSIYYGTEAFTDINDILDNMLLSLSMKSN